MSKLHRHRLFRSVLPPLSCKRLVALAGAVLLFTATAACARSVSLPDPSSIPLASPRWNGKLVSTNGQPLDGSAAMLTASDSSRTVVLVSLQRADPDAVHPWYVYSGECGSDGPMLGPASAYTPLRPHVDHTGSVSVSLPVPTPAGGSYHVNVHESPDDMGSIVACGELRLLGAADR